METAITFISSFNEITDEFDHDRDELYKIYKAFHEFAKYHEECFERWEIEKEKLLKSNSKLEEDIKSLEEKLTTARGYIDKDKKSLTKVLKERDHLLKQLDTVRELLCDGKNKLHDETKEKLSFLQRRSDCFDRLDTILELNSTDNMLSDLSHTIDDIDDSLGENIPPRKSKKNKRRSSLSSDMLPHENLRPKRSRASRRSVSLDRNEHIVATTTVTVPQTGPVSAVSKIESHPRNDVVLYTPSAPPILMTDSEDDTPLKNALLTPKPRTPFNMNLMNTRPHSWVQKAIIKGELCNACCKRMRFSKLAVKCKECKSVAHNMCKETVPLPCVPIAINTPTAKGKLGNISDFTPLIPPMVPPLVVHCVKEVEARGLTEVGLYRVPGSDKEVKTLKEKLLKVRGVPNLSQLDIHVVCGCLKDFLRSLREPLITQIRWFDFSRASDIRDPQERKARLFQIVSDLPQPNRETLAYIILHLQRIAATPEVKMSTSNLSKMFGPSIIGFSRNEPENMIIETNQGNKVMAELIALSTEHWESLIKNGDSNPPIEIQKTPSTNSVLNFFTPGHSVRREKNIKFFETP